MALTIGVNFDLSMRGFLDSRQQCESLEKLIANENNILYPLGFEVFCELEKAWYQNVALSYSVKPIWEIRTSGSSGDGSGGINSDVIDNDNISVSTTYSSSKIESLNKDLSDKIIINSTKITNIDENITRIDKNIETVNNSVTSINENIETVNKSILKHVSDLNETINNKINDTTESENTSYSSSKVNDIIDNLDYIIPYDDTTNNISILKRKTFSEDGNIIKYSELYPKTITSSVFYNDISLNTIIEDVKNKTDFLDNDMKDYLINSKDSKELLESDIELIWNSTD